MNSYPHDSIRINGRLVAVHQIISRNENALTAFENSTFAFISEWLRGAHEFEISTSGSTGSPKKILITRDQMIASAKLTGKVLGLQAGQTCLVCIDTKYI